MTRARDLAAVHVSGPVRPFFPRHHRPGVRQRVAVLRPDPRVWAVARDLAGDDCRRCTVLPDGSVIVWNGPRP